MQCRSKRGRANDSGGRRLDNRTHSSLAQEWAGSHPGVDLGQVGELTVVRYPELEVAAHQQGRLDLLHIHTISRADIEITPGRGAKWG